MCVLLITRLLRGVGRWARKPVNHTSWVAVVTPTDRPKSIRNCCLIELFCGVVCVVTLSLWHFCWYRGFCHRTGSDLLLFVSILWLHFVNLVSYLRRIVYEEDVLFIKIILLKSDVTSLPLRVVTQLLSLSMLVARSVTAIKRNLYCELKSSFGNSTSVLSTWKEKKTTLPKLYVNIVQLFNEHI